MTPELREKLGKVLAMLTSPHDGERLAAATRFSAILEANDIHPSAVLGNGSMPGLTEEQMSRIYAEGYARGVAETEQRLRPQRDWTPSGGSAEVGDDAVRLRQVLEAVEHEHAGGLLTEWEKTFSADMNERFNRFGNRMYGSERQWAILDRLETKLKRAGYSFAHCNSAT